MVVCLLFLKEAARGTELEIALQCFIPVIQVQIPGMVQEFDVLQPKSKGLDNGSRAPVRLTRKQH
jgi:hypothetical protein